MLPDGMFDRTTPTNFFAPRRQERKEKNLSISPNLAAFAPWNTGSTEVELFARSAIPQGESSSIRLPKCKPSLHNNPHLIRCHGNFLREMGGRIIQELLFGALRLEVR